MSGEREEREDGPKQAVVIDGRQRHNTFRIKNNWVYQLLLFLYLIKVDKISNTENILHRLTDFIDFL